MLIAGKMMPEDRLPSSLMGTSTNALVPTARTVTQMPDQTQVRAF